MGDKEKAEFMLRGFRSGEKQEIPGFYTYARKRQKDFHAYVKRLAEMICGDRNKDNQPQLRVTGKPMNVDVAAEAFYEGFKEGMGDE